MYTMSKTDVIFSGNDFHVSLGLKVTGLWEQPVEDPVSVDDLGMGSAEWRVGGWTLIVSTTKRMHLSFGCDHLSFRICLLLLEMIF